MTMFEFNVMLRRATGDGGAPQVHAAEARGAKQRQTETDEEPQG